VPGHRTLTVLGVTPQHRGVLYQRLFSSTAPNFVSEPHEVQTALTSVSQAIAALKAHMPVTWLLDSGFDDVAVWRTIWEQQGHLVCRIAHPERLVEREDGPGGWQAGTLAAARQQMALVALLRRAPRTRNTKAPDHQIVVSWRLGGAARARRPAAGYRSAGSSVSRSAATSSTRARLQAMG
jgi:hypothetical protein